MILFRCTARNLTMAATLALSAFAAALSPAHSEACNPVASAKVITPGKLVMAVNPTVPPFQFVSEKGELIGMRIEIGVELARHLCLDPEYMRMDFAATIPGLQAGRWDSINSGIVWTEPRSKLMYMVPYEETTMSVIVPSGNPLKIKTIDDLAGHSISVEAGTTEERRARELSKMVEAKGLKPVDVRVFNNFGDAIQAVKAGQADGQLNVQAAADHLAKQGGFESAVTGLFEETVCLAFRDRELADAAVKALTAMRADGSYQRIFTKWNGVQLSETTFGIKGPGPQ
jgi:polar amino acid transport system substrate-binding protein